MRKFLLSLWKDESGASAAEYALLLAVVSGVIALSAFGLGGAINTELQSATNAISNPSGAT